MPKINWEARRRGIAEWKQAQVMLARHLGRYVESGSDECNALLAEGWTQHSINYEGRRRMAFLLKPEVSSGS